MKNNHQEKSFKIDLLNLEKMSAQTMGVTRAGTEGGCPCKVIPERQYDETYWLHLQDPDQ